MSHSLVKPLPRYGVSRDVDEEVREMRDWRAYGPSTLDGPLTAALDVFVRHGYHGASIRAVAEAAGLSVPGLYHHYSSKQALLGALVGAVMDELLARSEAAAADSDGSPLTLFDHLVEVVVATSIHRRDLTFLASSEIRSMEPELRTRNIAQRDRQQHLLAEAVRAGVAEGTFDCAYPGDAARAVASLCVSVSSWYRPDGPLSADEIVERYLGFARAIAGAPARA